MAMASDPESWYAPYHFRWGMRVRNLLREAGYDEAWFGIDNLDCIYIQLVEEALSEEVIH